MILKLERSLGAQVRKAYGRYSFQVGIFEDKPHRQAVTSKRGLGHYAGGPARRESHRSNKQTVSQISEEIRKSTGINIYTRPFAQGKTRDVSDFTKGFFDLSAGRTSVKRVEELLLAIIRNPILRGEYGSNSAKAQKVKGFNRFLIDTAQLIKAISAKVQVKRVS